MLEDHGSTLGTSASYKRKPSSAGWIQTPVTCVISGGYTRKCCTTNEPLSVFPEKRNLLVSPEKVCLEAGYE